jgi:serine/threonine protein kinase/tetratricopeptide (TPR) repeat protein
MADPPISSITQEESDVVDVAAVRPRARSSSVPLERTLERGDKIGRYVVLGTIGRGGMGVVYSAWDPQLDRKIALKLVGVTTPDETTSELGSQHARLLREAQSLARLEHPNVVKVHDVGLHVDQIYIAMEHVEGHSLREWLRTRRRSVRTIVEVYRSAAQGLAAAHAAQLVHRDFKPDNVLVGEDGAVKVVDFGLAREAEGDAATPRLRAWSRTEPKVIAALEAAASEAQISAGDTRGGAVEWLDARASASDSAGALDSDALDSGGLVNSPPLSSLLRSSGSLTLAGAILGTPAYMAPEQHAGQAIDARSDQYSFCVSLWEAVYGKRPFSGRDPKQLAERKRRVQLRESTRGVPVPRWLRALLLRGLALEPEQRFADMRELIVALDRGLESRRGWGIALVGGLALVGALAASVVFGRRDAELCTPPLERLAGVWDTERRHEVEQALLASNAVYAVDTWTRVRDTLDVYRDEWLAAMVDACEAVHVERRETPDWLEQQLACLEERRRELVSLSGQLARSDAASVEHATRAARSLTPISTCARELGDDERMPMPGDPQERLRIGHELDRLGAAKAEFAAGRLVEGLALARDVLARARVLDWAPLEAEALLVIGDHVRDVERDATSEQTHLHAAARAGVRGKHWTLVLQAWAHLVRSLAQQGEGEAAARWLDQAQALADSLGPLGESPRLRAELLGARYHWHRWADRWAEAEADGRVRKDLLAQWYGSESPQVADALNAIGVTVYMQYRKDEAVELYRESLGIIERISGPDHPSVAAMHNNIGVVLTDKGRWFEARDEYLRSLGIRRKVFPRGHELLVQAQRNLANLFLLAGMPHGGIGPAREFMAVTAELTHERVAAAELAGRDADELATLRVELVPSLLLLGRMLAGNGEHHLALGVLLEASARVEQAGGRLPPGTSIDTDTPNLEGCRYDIAVELARAARARGNASVASEAEARVAASPSKPNHMQRCAYEVEDWQRSRSR